MALALGAAGWALYGHRKDFSSTFSQVGAGPVALSVGFGLIGVGATFLLWREILSGVGVSLPWGNGAQVFFVSQVGKYLPGSVWPVVMQMEAGRRRGATRAQMLWANLAALLLNCAVGLALATLLLPVYDSKALAQYWWCLLALPLLMVVLHPRLLPWLIDRVLRLLGRSPAGLSIQPAAEARAAVWSVLSWLALGAQLAVLVVASGSRGFSPVALAIGGMALAVPLGVLFLPAPAGAGIRDVVLLLVLRAVMPPGRALAVVVGSRAVLIVCDLALAGAAAAVGLRRRGAGERT